MGWGVGRWEVGLAKSCLFMRVLGKKHLILGYLSSSSSFSSSVVFIFFFKSLVWCKRIGESLRDATKTGVHF